MRLLTVPNVMSVLGGIIGLSFMLDSPESFVGGIGGISLTLALVNTLIRIEIERKKEK